MLKNNYQLWIFFFIFLACTYGNEDSKRPQAAWLARKFTTKRALSRQKYEIMHDLW